MVFRSLWVNIVGRWYARENRVLQKVRIGGGAGADSHGSGEVVGEVWLWW